MSTPHVAVIMGSSSDWNIMSPAVEMLEKFAIPCEARVISAHRATDLLVEYAGGLRERGFVCAIAGAGGAAHLAGVLAAKTTLPVLGVPIPSRYLKGMDSLLSTVQMPRGIPVATFAIGEAGAANAALFAVSMIAVEDAAMATRLQEFRRQQEEKVRNTRLPPQ
ncbi:MAG: 5-(carboxyamino)imidazole ribonucleotide mutase [Gammaproteobacteria bacterium]|jgi:5-(carboxyamino)imidazole ribonucleotide mutase